MKSKAKKLIRNILIGAVASLYNNDAQAGEISPKQLLEGLNGEEKKDVINALKNKIYKNVLKMSSNGNIKLIAGHRSHMSHRSGGGGNGGHYSHASHYSSYRSSRHSSHSSHSSSSYAPVSRPVPKTFRNYSLGDRTLKSGLYGNDVSILTSLLVTKKYLNGSWITMKNGYPLFNTSVVSAVKRFQKDAGLSQNGVFTSNLVNKLENWDSSKSTLILGIRNLAYNKDLNISGYDVNELIALLRKVGFPPNSLKLKYIQGKAVFTKDIETAVKLFQAYNCLEVTGVVNESIIKLLKSMAN